MSKNNTSHFVTYEVETQEEIFDTQLFPDHIFDGLPKVLRRGCDLYPPSSRERDVFFSSAVTLVSGCLPNVHTYYDNQKSYMNLYTMITAPPASGKGVVVQAGAYVKGIEEHLLNEYNQQVVLLEAQGIIDGEEEEKSKKHKPKIPRKRHVIPANSSSASFLGILADNDGNGTIFEPEADTLAQSQKQEWGNFSDTLRKGYHHEPVSYSRKMDNSHVVIDCPKLTMLLAGTPRQVGSLGLNSPENGLQSRVNFYYFDSLPSFKLMKGRKDNSRQLTMESLGNIMCDIYRQLSYNQAGIEIVLTDGQWDFFSNWYARKMEVVTRKYNGYTSAMIRRSALSTIRIAGILTILHEYESDPLFRNDKVCCTWQTLRKALAIAEVYMNHNLVIFRCSEMATPDTTMHAYIDFYNLLPAGEFNRKDVLDVAAAVGFSERTLDRRLEKLRKSGKLISMKGGLYKKHK